MHIDVWVWHGYSTEDSSKISDRWPRLKHVLVGIRCLKSAESERRVLEAVSFFRCLGAKCSYYKSSFVAFFVS